MLSNIGLQALLAALLYLAAPGSAVAFSIHRWPTTTISRGHHDGHSHIGTSPRGEKIQILTAETGAGNQIYPKLPHTPALAQEAAATPAPEAPAPEPHQETPSPAPTQELSTPVPVPETPAPVPNQKAPTPAPVQAAQVEKPQDAEDALFKDHLAMQIVYSVCGNTIKQEFLNSLKSLYLFAVSSLSRGPAYYHIHVLTDGAIAHANLAFLKPKSNFKASIHGTHPGATTLFKNCSTERIYLHQHQDFLNIDRIIYVDTDSLWMDDPIWWWTHFAHMDTLSAIYGLAEEAPEGTTWYTAVKIPHWGERGLQAGVMMASLNRVRVSNFSAERDDIIAYWAPKGELPLGDQDILNIYFYYHPEELYLMPCIFNFRYDARCPEGWPVLFHGNRQIWKQPHTSFNHLYTFFSKIDFNLAWT